MMSLSRRTRVNGVLWQVDEANRYTVLAVESLPDPRHTRKTGSSFSLPGGIIRSSATIEEKQRFLFTHLAEEMAIARTAFMRLPEVDRIYRVGFDRDNAIDSVYFLGRVSLPCELHDLPAHSVYRRGVFLPPYALQACVPSADDREAMNLIGQHVLNPTA